VVVFGGILKEAMAEGGFGCKHYRKKCWIVAPCCGRTYVCRVCHDENEGHLLPRREIAYVKCMRCLNEQSPSKNCFRCNTEFAWYYCPVCKFYDDEKRGQFHCTGCGLCRVGGAEHFIHCARCGYCISVRLEPTHKCVLNASKNDCPICLEDIHTSRTSAQVLPCGHLIHEGKCYDGVKQHGFCPICREDIS